jgi:exosome complex component RRP46
MIYTASLLAVARSGEIIWDPSLRETKSAASLHVLAFSLKGHLLLNESEGSFDFDTWERIYEHAEAVCRGRRLESADGDVIIEDSDGHSLENFLRDTVKDKVHRDYA